MVDLSALTLSELAIALRGSTATACLRPVMR